ncbi:DNA repair protein RadC [Acetobacter sp. DmW_136]|uniref:JAB domain-containing protein n=1 Tax=Acetobacter sp. DmW_136 TaxID=2591091 RepID=UPI0012386E25|nr:DNA repair protein RadC [Acetobacter sp. DmW_136]KAA8386951.1 DNA repair protein RadC [Acetobacter sp. DmW_136]
MTRPPTKPEKKATSQFADATHFRLNVSTAEAIAFPAEIYGGTVPEASGAEETDFSLLCRLIVQAQPRNAKAQEQAQNLLHEYGNLSAVMAAISWQEPSKSIKALPEAARILLMLARETGLRIQRARLRRSGILADSTQLYAYLRAVMGPEKREQVRVLFLNEKHQLLVDDVMGQGTVDHTPVYPREIVSRALQLKATILVLVHNHPSGDPTPSADDVVMTTQICGAAKIMNIHVWDHIIVAGEKLLSMREAGLL